MYKGNFFVKYDQIFFFVWFQWKILKGTNQTILRFFFLPFAPKLKMLFVNIQLIGEDAVIIESRSTS